MSNILNGFLDNFLSGVSNPGGNLRDAQHAQRLYVDNAFRLAPKVKFLYFVVFNLTSEALAIPEMKKLSSRHRAEINMLVKEVTLPGYSVQSEIKNQYNRKKNVQTRIDYDPVTIRMHDDNLGVTTAMLEAYYKYYYKDGVNTDTSAYDPRNAYKGEESHKFKYGLDTSRATPFFRNIQVFQLSRHEFTSFTLVNPLITKWQHDTMSQSSGAEVSENAMVLNYESVFYNRGVVGEDNPATFATSHYDTTPSPLQVAGGGTASVFGLGGVGTGIGEIIGDISSGNFGLDTIIKGANVIKNSDRLTKEGIIEEGFSIIGKALGNVTNDSPGGFENTTFPSEYGGSYDIINTVEATVSTISSGVTEAAKYAAATISAYGDTPAGDPYGSMFE